MRQLHEEQGVGPSDIASRLGISRASVYRILAEQKPELAFTLPKEG